MPYFTAAVLGLVPRKTDAVPTMAVSDRLVMSWNPSFIDILTVQQCAAVIVHEANHIIRQHGARCRAIGADPALWNLAGDAEINDDLKAAGLDLPGCGIFPHTLGQPDGRTAEEYYHSIPRDGGSNGSGKGDKPGEGECGSCAHGHGEEGEDGDAEGRSQQDAQRIIKTVADDIQRHAQQHGRGSVPAGLARWADEALKPPRVRWQDQLARITRRAVAYKAGAVDLRWSKPARKQAGVGHGVGRPMLPALVAPIPRVMVAIDTSGSMGEAELNAALTEVNAILKAVGGDVDFVSCDAAVNAQLRARTWRDVARNLKGGGGTDFRPVFEAAARARPRPEVLVFATDGCGPAPDAAPTGMSVVWLLLGSYRQTPAPWGTVIEVDDNARAAR
jgi:predicted metal-dependent peptidase